jgi:hypothetical protein
MPWTQRLSEVRRMRDPAERTASLTVGDGGPPRCTAPWTRIAPRTGCTPATPSQWHMTALDAYRGDVAAGKDALRCVTPETERQRSIDYGRGRSQDQGLDYGIDL